MQKYLIMAGVVIVTMAIVNRVAFLRTIVTGV